MQAFQQNLAKLEAADTQVLGVSMDSSYSNQAWAEKIGITFPFLSDWGGDVTKEYGLYNPKYKAARACNSPSSTSQPAACDAGGLCRHQRGPGGAGVRGKEA